jgi:hypothetical protein
MVLDILREGVQDIVDHKGSQFSGQIGGCILVKVAGKKI